MLRIIPTGHDASFSKSLPPHAVPYLSPENKILYTNTHHLLAINFNRINWPHCRSWIRSQLRQPFSQHSPILRHVEYQRPPSPPPSLPCSQAYLELIFRDLSVGWWDGEIYQLGWKVGVVIFVDVDKLAKLASIKAITTKIHISIRPHLVQNLKKDLLHFVLDISPESPLRLPNVRHSCIESISLLNLPEVRLAFDWLYVHCLEPLISQTVMIPSPVDRNTWSTVTFLRLRFDGVVTLVIRDSLGRFRSFDVFDGSTHCEAFVEEWGWIVGLSIPREILELIYGAWDFKVEVLPGRRNLPIFHLTFTRSRET